MKVLYQTVFEDVFHFPSIQVGHKGWLAWLVLNIIMYPLVFVVAAAIPQLFTISALFAALFGLQFSYTFPPLLQLAYDMCADASRLDGVFVPGQPPQRYDTWMSFGRWRRGLFGGTLWSVMMKMTNCELAFSLCGVQLTHFIVIYFLAGLALCGLAAWGSIETIIITFTNGAGTSFGCTPFV